jgi:carbonic anhydrase
LLFDQKLGEVFVVRTAGESTGANTLASVEYAVEHLGAKLIVVMGHTRCGAIKAAIESQTEKAAASPSLISMVEDILPRIKSVAAPNNGPAFEKEAWANADGIAADLINQSAIIKKAVGSGEIKVIIALYHVETGKVEFAD